MFRRENRRFRQVQCMGDSITHGTASTGLQGYRAPLFAALRAYGFYSCGSQGAGGSDVYTQLHDGFDGYPAITVGAYPGLETQLAAIYVGTWVQPDLIVLMAGMNSLYRGRTPAETAADLRTLRGLIRSRVPSVYILNLSLTPVVAPSAVDDALVAQVGPLVAGDVAGEENAAYLDVHTPLLPMAGKLSVDGVHPNDAGYAQLASIIVPAVLALPIFP